MISREKLEEIRANVTQQRDQAVGALAVIEHLLSVAAEKPVEQEELENMLGAKLMSEPEPIDGERHDRTG